MTGFPLSAIESSLVLEALWISAGLVVVGFTFRIQKSDDPNMLHVKGNPLCERLFHNASGAMNRPMKSAVDGSGFIKITEEG
jgi:hypothetical protein